MHNAGTLYLIATPIGNLEDITLRALRLLREVDIIAAEDTRVTRKLLSHYDIHTPMTSYNQHSKGAKIQELLEALLEGKQVAVVSDAGTPGISDPGHDLVELAIEHNVRVEPIPGACAVISALTVSGLSTTEFIFEGFPPRKDSERRAFFTGLAPEYRTICLYEAPLRLLNTLQSMRECLGNRQIAVARELTKKFEEVFRGTVDQAIERFESVKPRGEIVIILEGAAPATAKAPEEIAEQVRALLCDLQSQGLSNRDSIRQCAVQLGIPRKQVYQIALEREETPE